MSLVVSHWKHNIFDSEVWHQHYGNIIEVQESVVYAIGSQSGVCYPYRVVRDFPESNIIEKW